MTTVSKFPLLQLPQQEIRRTLRVMDIYQNLSFSLISKRCKKLIESLQIKAKTISASIGSSINIWIVSSTWFLDLIFQDSDEVDQKRRLGAPLYVRIPAFLRFERVGFEYSDWLEHLQTIFHCPPFAYIRFHQGSSEYDLDEIKRVFGATKKISAQHTGCYAYNLRIFQKYFPIEKLGISPNMFEDSKIPLNILQQNFATLDIYGDRNDPTEMTLNELLVMNSKRNYIKDVRVSSQEVNKFIKLWMKGSNPRMEYFCYIFTGGVHVQKDMVMKGIKHSYQPMEELDISEIYKICRIDGTGATVMFSDYTIQFFVRYD